VYMSVSAGGSTQTDTLIALAIVGVWIVVGAVWLILNSAANKTSLLVKPQIVSPERQ
jgi:heme/copper-type cytochrome/quinol oxidase subunit 4